MAKLTFKPRWTRPAMATVGLVMALPFTAGVASAQPQIDLAPVVNTTCTYDQVMAALNKEQPALAQQFNEAPLAQGVLRNFLAAPPAERQQTAVQLQANPMVQEYFGPISSIAASCKNY